MADLSPEYLERFGGIARLYGQDALIAFSKAHVAIVGIGGVGSWVAESMARSGIGTISLIDLDDVCVTNTNRQIHAISENIGRPKITVMAERLKAINPEIEFMEGAFFYNESNTEKLFALKPTVIIDAIDSVRQKAQRMVIASACWYEKNCARTTAFPAKEKENLKSPVSTRTNHPPTHGQMAASALPVNPIPPAA